MQFFPLMGAFIFGCITLFTLLVTLGTPLGEFTLGGKYKILPTRMRITSGISLIVQIIAIITILVAGGIIAISFPFNAERVLCIFFGCYLLLNTVLNAISSSKKERYLMTPLSLLSSICFFITAFSF
ncbi:DUF308 domain-containing protein [Bacillus sp. SD088]|uniref:DUF308 domain-containing protein n=1 Tax=Bacillus sp. SD088 TaxID=2782012 RepID=UPI001A97B53E|nr:DUF308 domain-containing protein [Bacillus sp. SD088]MBO0993690.1 DUF308 domain-containing protein [Bacillus sp. SD088]